MQTRRCRRPPPYKRRKHQYINISLDKLIKKKMWQNMALAGLEPHATSRNFPYPPHAVSMLLRVLVVLLVLPLTETLVGPFDCILPPYGFISLLSYSRSNFDHIFD